MFFLHCQRLLAVAIYLLATSANAAPTTNSLGADLNDSLLSGDLNDLLKDLPLQDPPPPARPADVGEDLGAEQSKPLELIAQGMATSKGLIDQGEIAVTAQKKVIDDLDELIRQAEKQCQACQNPSPGSSGSKPRQQSQRSKPKPKPSEQAGQEKKPGQPGAKKQSQQAAQQSTARLGSAAGASAESNDAADHMKEIWGRLPQRLREQMLESSSDEFLPQYREEIERYYRKLAEEPQE